MTQNTDNYTEQGGARTVIGGSLDVVSGGELDIESGGALKIDGVAVTATAAEINAGTIAGILATGDELNRVADVSTRIVSAAAATLTVALADHESKTVVLNRATGVAVTMPAATGSGARYRFVVGTAMSGGSSTFGMTGDDTMQGVALGTDDDGVPANSWRANGATVITLDGSTQGGKIGDVVEFEDIAADVWAVRLLLQQSGTEATPFS